MRSDSVKATPAAAKSLSKTGLEYERIQGVVEEVLKHTVFIDIHTHLFPPAFGKLGLWGIDELLTYHYLEAEFFRSSEMMPEVYFQLPKAQQADAIWRALFVENSPVSEATRGVVAVLQAFGLPTDACALGEARNFFRTQTLNVHLKKTMNLAGVDVITMTNDPLDPEEQHFWMRAGERDPRFRAALRLDRILLQWPAHYEQLQALGYSVDSQFSNRSIGQIRRFLADWHQRMAPTYLAASLPDTFQFPEDTICSRILTESVLPASRELNLPLALMIGVRRQVNPWIRLAGDGVGRSDLRSLENLCRTYSENRFFVTVLSRENQHELCVLSRKFSNLMPFGCWWFLNNPSVVEEITRERIEMLGTSFIPQHSDARVLEQLIYKWKNTRTTMAKVLGDTYRLLARDGRAVLREDIERDVKRLFRGNFQKWTGVAYLPS
jgi:hypothetical protein